MSSFRAAVQKEYGDFLRAWPKVFDKNKNNMCEYDEFCAALNRLDYKCQSRKLLWNLLLPEKGRTYLSLEDLDERAYRAHARGSAPNWGDLEWNFNPIINSQEFRINLIRRRLLNSKVSLDRWIAYPS